MNELENVYDGDFSVFSTRSLNGFNQEFIKHTQSKFEEFKEIFGVEKLSKLTFVLFDDLEEYRKYRREKYGAEPPVYSRGCFFKDTAVLVIEKVPEKGTKEFYLKRASGAHEAFHVYYRDLVYKESKERVVWFDEGMAQYFSGEREYLDQRQFRDYYSKFKQNYTPINNLNDRIQGNSTVSNEEIFQRKGVIDGYTISYLAVRYLAETKGIDFVKGIMKDRGKILELGKTISKEMLEYYNSKLLEIELDER